MKGKVFAVACRRGKGRRYYKYIRAYEGYQAEEYIRALSGGTIKPLRAMVVGDDDIPAGEIVLECTQFFS